jgi:hypothetical protein
MSHVTRVNLVADNLDDLDAACQHLGGLRLDRDVEWFRYYDNNRERCLHKIVATDIPDAYELGIIQNPDGRGFTFLYDSFAGAGGMNDLVGGKDLTHIRQAYARCAAVRTMGEQGYSFTERTLSSGKVELQFHRAY